MKSFNQYREKEVNKTAEKQSAIIVCRILFFGCFFMAVLMANTIWENEAVWVGYMYHHLIDDAFVRGEGYGNFFYILVHRLPIWLFLFVVGQCRMGRFLANIFAGWEGMLIGLALAVLIMRYGLVGIIILFLIIFPQWAAYVISYISIYQYIFRMKEKRNYFVVISTFLTGIFLESYVNVIFLSKMLDLVEKI